jgi:hypothetical protein
MLDDVRVLAEEIGPRGTGTPAETAAALFVAERLEALNLEIERHTFRAVTSQNAFPLAINIVALLAAALYFGGGAVGRWLGAGLALTTPPLLWQTIRMSNSPLRPLLPKVTSRNVVAHVRSQGETCQQAVLLAHLDTNCCRIAWQSSAVRSLEPLTYLTLAMLASLGLLFLAGAVFGLQWTGWAALLPVAYTTGAMITLWQDERTPFSPGAHDNAASVAVALEVARRLAARPLERTQLWLAFTGAEETDHAGLYTLLRHHGTELREAAFIGLEGLGSGEIVYLTQQGLCFHYEPDADLVALAAIVASRQPDLGLKPAQMTMEDEVGTLRRLGYRAMCIAGRDPATGTLPHWHRADDTADTISPEFMARAADVIVALLVALDGQTFSTQQEELCGHL